MVFSGTSDVICCFWLFHILFCCYINLQQEFVWWFKIQINHINFIQIKHSISLQWIQTVNHEINKVASSCLAHKDTKTLIILVWEQYEVRGHTGTSSRTWQSNGNTTIYTIPVIRNWLVLCELDRAIQSDSRSLMKICQYLRIVLFNVNPSQSGTMDNGGPGKLTGSLCFCFLIQSFLTVNTIKVRNCFHCQFPNCSWHHLLNKITQHCLQICHVIIMTRNIIIIWGKGSPMIENQQDLQFLFPKISHCLCKAQSNSL